MNMNHNIQTDSKPCRLSLPTKSLCRPVANSIEMKAARALLRPLLPLIRSAAMHHVTTPVRAASSLSRGAWRTMETNPRFTRGLQLSIEPTPNPDSEKFIPEGQVVLPPELGKGMVRS